MKKVNVGILGFGKVGGAVVDLIEKNHSIIAQKTGLDLKIVAIADPKPKKKHPLLLNNAEKVLNDPSIDTIVEAIGGNQPALNYILRALYSKKNVVTSNKEVIALNAQKIFSAAKNNGVSVLMEGSVGGGIPILQALRESLNANQITEVYGIVNGTTNYILSKMTEDKMEFSEALRRAKEKGYAEANPVKDIEGRDAAFKAAILAMTAFGIGIDFKKVYFEGISRVTPQDIIYAADIGYVIKLLAVAKNNNGDVEVRVHPTFVPKDHPLASVSGPMNAIYIKGDATGELMFYGQGAGGLPTASAVVNDIIQIGAIHELPQSGAFRKLISAKMKPMGKIVSRYYLHLIVPDRSGVLAQISKVFAEERVSIQAVLQKESVGKFTPLVIILHDVAEERFNAALSKIKRLRVVQRVQNMVRVGL